MMSLDEHVDLQMMKQLLGEVLHRAGAPPDGPAPDPEILSTVVLSRWSPALLCNVCIIVVCHQPGWSCMQYDIQAPVTVYSHCQYGDALHASVVGCLAS